jgi:predicted TIM-barrel fold metal-dependent hydrolase
MDQYGIDVSLLYPNLVGFQAPVLAELGGDLALECIRIYNDFAVEWTSPDPNRLIAIAMLPYWDRDESIREMTRCVGLGHHGVLFANKFERIGLPDFCDSYWDTVYAAAQDLDISINYHIGFTSDWMADYTTPEAIAERRDGGRQARLNRALSTASSTVQLGDLVGQIVTSGVCERFPRLKFVSVESGFGYLPFYLEALDWSWRTGGATFTGELLPSEYFRRQCYGTLWFETTTLPLLEVYPDNFMFSTDFPHPTSLSPGPASPSYLPIDHIHKYYGKLDSQIRARVLGDNAAAIYKLDRNAARGKAATGKGTRDQR